MPTLTEKKILNAIKYFKKNTLNFGLTKMFKLLYFLDFMYLKKHGLEVTTLEYLTYEFGPVPDKLYKQITNNTLPDYLKNEIKFIKDWGNEEFSNPQYKITISNPTPDLSCFTPYERKMLEEIAFIFKEADAETMTEASHLKNQPWYKTKTTKGMFQPIDFELALDEESDIDLDELLEYLEIQREQKLDGRI